MVNDALIQVIQELKQEITEMVFDGKYLIIFLDCNELVFYYNGEYFEYVPQLDLIEEEEVVVDLAEERKNGQHAENQ